jgi:CTP:molybdopterin cytidylyltransferase MocA
VTAAIVLAAGGSTRLGEPKQLAMLGGATLLERAVRTAREAGCAPIVVVLGAAQVEIMVQVRIGDAVLVINDKWQEGMSSSIRAGMQALAVAASAPQGAVVMTCDQPAVTAQHLRALTSGQELRASRYAGRNGVPAYFPQKYFRQLLKLDGDAGARNLLARADSEELAYGELDVDTADDLARARELFG